MDGLVIPGGESTAIAKVAELSGLLDPMRAWVKEGKPVYGTCAGLILLSEVEAQRVGGQQLLGGINITSKRNRWGRQSESFNCLLDAPAINKGDERKPAQAVFIRAPGIVRVGEGVEVIASIPADVIAEHEKKIGGRGVGVFVGHLEEPAIKKRKGNKKSDEAVAVRQGALLATTFHPELTGDDRWHRFFTKMVIEAGKNKWKK